MNETISFDGTKVQLQPLDLDKDGKTGGIEKVYRHDPGTKDIIQPSELGETLKELNQDKIDPTSRMSGIDMRSRLHPIEIIPILVLDSLVGLKFLPSSVLPITKQKKRLAVSQHGKGREEMVNVAVGKREQDKEKSQGFFSKLLGGKQEGTTQ